MAQMRSGKRRVLDQVFLGIGLLFLFHFESISIGFIKISHIWKGALLIFLLHKLFSHRRVNFFIYSPLVFLAFSQLINNEIFNDSFNAFFLFGTTLMLPLLGMYVLKFSGQQLEKSLIFFASFFILCFVPYHLGLLESLSKGYDLTSFGEEARGLVGPFQTVHSASTALAGSILVLIFFWFSKTYNRSYVTFLLVLGLYFLLNTYVRTGMAMVILGIIPIIWFFMKNQSTRRYVVIFGILASVILSNWVLSNEILVDKITGQRAKNSEMESIENLGSGRGLLYISSIDIFNDLTPLEKFIGIGQSQQLREMEKRIGLSLIPHNGFLLVLLNNGLLGLFLLLTFLRNQLAFYRRLKGAGRVFVLSLMVAYGLMTFFQNYDMVYMYLIMVLGVAYVKNLQLNKGYEKDYH